MNRVQAHRGPDASGIYEHEHLTLGHVRLSIIDLDARSNQPYVSRDARYALSFNGEIYNHEQLRARLAARGVKFRTTSDTEVLLESYRLFGADCVDDFEGMFAFAIYDAVEQRLVCARDRAGEKPFHYYWSEDLGFLCASEFDALIAATPVTPEPDAEALAQFLSTGYMQSPDTLLRDFRQLPPGHMLSTDAFGPPVIRCYWSPYRAWQKAHELGDGEIEEYLETFDRAVHLCQTSDVPVGAFLSGGIDSTCVVESSVRQDPSRCNGTFTLDYRDTSYSETPVARETADKLGLDATFVPYEEHIDDLCSVIVDKAARVPIADPSFLGLYLVARAAGQRFKVVLGGDGADELMVGYDTYRATWLSNHLGGWRMSWLRRWLDHIVGGRAGFAKNVSTREKLWRFMTYRTAGDPLRSHMSWRTLFSTGEISALLGGRPVQDVATRVLRALPDVADWARAQDVPLLNQAAIADLSTWLADGVLRKADSALMYHSLEGRAPFLNHKVIESAFRLPLDRRARRLQGKQPLRKRLARKGLEHVVKLKKKGFGFPLDALFRDALRPLLTERFGSPAAAALFDATALKRYFDEHMSGRFNHGRKLYCLLILVCWYEGTLARDAGR